MIRRYFPDLFVTGRFHIPWGSDLLASAVVFLVALPLCMGIAIASDVPPALGLITGIVGGVVVGAIAGSPLQVSGPAAGLAVICYDFVQAHGLRLLGVAVLAAGAIQLVSGLLRLGRWFRATAPAVIQGMLAGIGILIFAGQFHVMVDDAPRQGGLANLVAIPEAVAKGISLSATDSHHLAALTGLVTLVVLVLWTNFRPKALKALPAALLAVIAGGGLAVGLGFDIEFVNVPAAISDSFNVPALADFARLGDTPFLIEVIAIAVIASAETLLCASAADQLHTGPRTRYDQELFAQGVGNLVCGAFGALPMTGVIVRTSANVEAGGKTRASAVLHGVMLLILVVALPGLLAAIPKASLAAILVYTGYRLVNLPAAVRLWRFSRAEFTIASITVALIVADNLLTGVIVGLTVSALRLLVRFSRLEVEIEDHPESGRVEITLHGAATFVSLPKMAEALDAIDPKREAHLHLKHLSYIDHACLELLSSWEAQREASGGSLTIEWGELHAMYANKMIYRDPDDDARARGQVAQQFFKGGGGH